MTQQNHGPAGHVCEPEANKPFSKTLDCSNGDHDRCDGTLHIPAGCCPCQCEACKFVFLSAQGESKDYGRRQGGLQ